jgi:hypothetical protein
MFVPTIMKRMLPENSEGIPLPKYCGDLIELFLTKIRKLINKKEQHVETIWINSFGNPASKLIFTSDQLFSIQDNTRVHSKGGETNLARKEYFTSFIKKNYSNSLFSIGIDNQWL